MTPVFRDSGSTVSGQNGASASAAKVCPTLRSLARRGNSSVGLSVFNLKSDTVGVELNG